MATIVISDMLRQKESPTTGQRKVVQKDQLRYWRRLYNWVVQLVQDSCPRRSLLCEPGISGSKHAVKFSNCNWHQVKIREKKGPSRGNTKVCASRAKIRRKITWGDLAPCFGVRLVSSLHLLVGGVHSVTTYPRGSGRAAGTAWEWWRIKREKKLDGMESSKSKSDAHFMHGWDETNTRTTWATRCGVQIMTTSTKSGGFNGGSSHSGWVSALLQARPSRECMMNDSSRNENEKKKKNENEKKTENQKMKTQKKKLVRNTTKKLGRRERKRTQQKTGESKTQQKNWERQNTTKIGREKKQQKPGWEKMWEDCISPWGNTPQSAWVQWF